MAWNPVPGIIENLLAEGLIAALSIGAVVTWLNKIKSAWLVPLCWGLGAFVVVLVGVGALRVIATPVTGLDITTFSNIEDRVRTWVDNFNLSEQNEPIESAFFRRLITMPNGNRIIISRPRDLDKYVLLQTVLTPGAGEQVMWKKLTPKQLSKVTSDVKIELARSKINFKIGDGTFVMILEKRIPIAPDLTESVLVQQIDDMDSAATLAQLTTMENLERYGILP
jgi:hypothetical protein